MKRCFFAVLALAALPLWGQSPSDEAVASRPAAVVDVLPGNIRRAPLVNAGEGISARYPGDRGIRSDARVLFVEDFESADPFSTWTERKSPETVRVVEDDAGGGGHRALAMTADLKSNAPAYAFRRLPYGVDRLYVRFYTKFVGPAEYLQHFVQMSADEPPRLFPTGGAGVCPDGGKRFATAIEPFGHRGRFPAPGAWHMLSYWCEMAISSDAKYWGNEFEPETPSLAKPDVWTCIEFMTQANSAPTARDGVQAFWVDGKPVARFEGYRWRTNPKLKLNGILFQNFATEAAAKAQGSLEPKSPTTVLFDDMVVATEYIGPRARVD